MYLGAVDARGFVEARELGVQVGLDADIALELELCRQGPLDLEHVIFDPRVGQVLPAALGVSRDHRAVERDAFQVQLFAVQDQGSVGRRIRRTLHMESRKNLAPTPFTGVVTDVARTRAGARSGAGVGGA